MKLPKFTAIVRFSKKRWVFNFKHFRKNGRFHVMVNRKPKKPYSQLHSKKFCTTFPSFRIRNEHVNTINTDCE